MKRCGKCLIEKDESNFYRHNRDGFQSICKECKRELGRIANGQPKRKTYNKERYKEWYKKNGKEYFLKYFSDPVARMKREARWQAKEAIRSGLIKKMPCVNCGSTKILEAHHKDYYKPLEVIWLCQPCHRAVHRK